MRAYNHLRTLISMLSTGISLRGGSASALSTNTKTALVTGSTDGIGLTTAKNLAAKGYNVILHGRDAARIDRAQNIVQSFVASSNKRKPSHTPGKIMSIQSDLSTIENCRDLAQRVRALLASDDLPSSSLDLLVNNAGVFEENYKLTEDGLEMTFAVNVVAPFVITSHLLPELLRTDGGPSRVVIASSISQCSRIDHWDDLNCQKRAYSTHRAYSESKLMDAMLTFEFARIFESNGFGTDKITCNCLDPGTVNTKMLLAGWGACGIDVESALDETWLSTSDEVADVTGSYFCSRRSRKASSDAYKVSERSKLWAVLSSIDPQSAEMWGDLKSLQ